MHLQQMVHLNRHKEPGKYPVAAHSVRQKPRHKLLKNPSHSRRQSWHLPLFPRTRSRLSFWQLSAKKPVIHLKCWTWIWTSKPISASTPSSRLNYSLPSVHTTTLCGAMTCAYRITTHWPKLFSSCWTQLLRKPHQLPPQPLSVLLRCKPKWSILPLG